MIVTIKKRTFKWYARPTGNYPANAVQRVAVKVLPPIIFLSVLHCLTACYSCSTPVQCPRDCSHTERKKGAVNE